MGIKSWVKKAINTILNIAIKPLLKKYIIDPLKRHLKKLGFGMLIGFIDKIFEIIFGLIDFFLNFIYIWADILDFLVKFFMIIIEIFTNIGYYITRPFKLVIILIKLFITFVTCLLGIAYHNFEVGDNLKAVEWILYSTIIFSMYQFVTMIHIVFWLVWRVFVEYLILNNIDKATGGAISTFMYKYFEACENPPDAWYMTPGWHKGNKNKKYIFAYNACEAGYTANNVSGLFCQKNSPYELELCPQVNLYRLMNDKETKGKLHNPDFNPNTQEFLKKNSLGKQRMIDEYIDVIKTNNKVCSQTMKSKDTILKTHCSKSTNNKSVESQLCYDIYCRNDKREPFCHKLEYMGKNNTVKISQSFESLIVVLIFITFIVLASGHYLKNTSSS